MGALISVCIFLMTLLGVEAVSSILLGNGAISPERPSHPAHTFVTVEDAKRLSNSPGRTGELARRLLEFGVEEYEKRINPTLNNFQEVEPGQYNAEISLYGLILPAGIDADYKKTSMLTGKTIYQYHVKTNEFHRRVTRGETKTAEENILFYGCSYTFGEGVEADDTIPGQLAGMLPARTYNFGMIGAGPVETVISLEKHGDSILGGIPETPTTVVYTFIDDHLRRAVKNSKYLGAFVDGHKSQYFFRMNEKGELSWILGKDSGLFDFYWLRAFFGKTAFARISRVEFPWINDYHLKLTAKLFARQRELTKKRIPQLKEFVVAFFPQESFYARELIPYLEAENIKTLDYSQISSRVLNGYEYLPKDGHPTKDLYRLYSWLLAKDLQGR